jgi:MoxR-like ATPase
MAESQVTVDGERHLMHKPFFVIATQNPSETLGTYVLPDAQKDRFIFRTEIGYPSPEAERALWIGEHEQRINPILDLNDIVAAQEEVKKIAVSPKLLDYLQALIQQTRTDHSVTSGLSPRAGLLWLRAAKSRAWLLGRSHVVPEDLQALMFPVAGHRIQMGSINHPEQIRAKVRGWIESTPVG